MMMKRLILCTLLGLFCSGGFAADKTDLILATATTGGTYYPVGVAIATLNSIKLAKKERITMNAITSGGSAENILLLKRNEAQLAILQGLFGSMAWQGKGLYKGKPQKDIRSITMLWQNVEHFTVLKDKVKTGNIQDLKAFDKAKFSISSRNSGSRVSGETILNALQINPNNCFTLEYMGYASSAKALRDGRICGMNTPAGPPASAVTQVFANLGADKVRILEFTESQLKQINQDHPVWSAYTIPAKTYPGLKQAVKTIAQPNFLAVRKDIDEHAVYLITKTIYENLGFLHNIHAATKMMNIKKAIAGLPMPLHPGAAKYYREIGIKIPKHLEPKQ